MRLTERKSKILSSVVDHFIARGEPISSKAIADQIGVSSATIRNEMADLIQLGLLEQPHTSAGRIPSQKGYRQYVNGLSANLPLPEQDRAFFDGALQGNAYDAQRLLGTFSRLLAAYSKYVSVITTPGGNGATVRAVQFVQISRRTAMLILMSSAGTVRNQVFHCDYDLKSEIIRMFFRVFNERLTGMLVSEINVAFIQSMAASLGELSMLSASPLVALLEVAQETVQSELLLGGMMNLLLYPELEYTEVREIHYFLEDKDAVNRLLTRNRKQVCVRIGSETECWALRNASVVFSRYDVNQQDAGAIAVIGPMRMDYQKMLQTLAYVSKQVENMLTILCEE